MCEMTMLNHKFAEEIQRLKLDDLENCIKKNAAPNEKVVHDCSGKKVMQHYDKRSLEAQSLINTMLY